MARKPPASHPERPSRRPKEVEAENSRFHRLRRIAGVATELRSLERIAESLQLGLTITDLDGRIVYTNPAEAEMHGWQVDDLLGEVVRVMAPPQTWSPMSREQVRSVRRRHRESLNVRRDGSLFPVEIHSDSVLDENGEPIGVVSITTDITERKAREEELRRAEAELAATIENTTDAIATLDKSGRVVVANSALRSIARALFGLPVERGTDLVGQLDEAAGLWWRQRFDRTFAGERISESRTVRIGDETRHFEASFQPVRARDRGTVGASIFLRDVTARVEAERALRESEERYASARGIVDGLWDWDLDSGEISFSPRWRALLGLTEAEAGHTPEAWFARIHPEDVERVRAEIALHLEGGTPQVEVEHRVRHADGSWRWMLARGLAIRDESGQARRLAGTQIDITGRKVVEARLLWDAQHDSLTSLPNRTWFLSRLVAALDAIESDSPGRPAVLFLDVDHFKELNDRLGHEAGDELLRTLAARLKGAIRPGDLAARLGGDEFVILLGEVREPGEAMMVARRVLESIVRPFSCRDSTAVKVTSSIGVAIASGPSDRPEHLLRNADAAMYRAKMAGRARVQLYDEALGALAEREDQLRAGLVGALARGEIRIGWEPVVRLDSGRLAGFEVLPLWHHPVLGPLGPDCWRSVAEESGEVFAIESWLLDAACRRMADWRTRGLGGGLGLRIPFSPRGIAERPLARELDELFHRLRFDPRLLCLEVPGAAIHDDDDPDCRRLRQVADLGVVIGLDEVALDGMPLGCLLRSPIGALKLPAALTLPPKAAGRHAFDAEAIVMLSGRLDLEVTAGGIASDPLLARARELGCTYAQGPLFSPTLAVDEAERLVVRGDFLH